MRLTSILYATLCAIAVLTSCSKKNDETTATPKDADWNYESTSWQNVGYSECGNRVQSPINIVTADAVTSNLSNVRYSYSPFAMSIADNGHAIEVRNNTRNAITVNGKRYRFLQFHFHQKGEHTLDGRSFPLELHIVHQDSITGSLVVLGVLFQQSNTDNPFISKIVNNIPSEKKKPVQTQESLLLSDVIPADPSYYTYTGSFTIPPCSSGVGWIVFKQPLPVSAAQLARFTRVYPGGNSRPIQPLNTRVILKN